MHWFCRPARENQVEYLSTENGNGEKWQFSFHFTRVLLVDLVVSCEWSKVTCRKQIVSEVRPVQPNFLPFYPFKKAMNHKRILNHIYSVQLNANSKTSIYIYMKILKLVVCSWVAKNALLPHPCHGTIIILNKNACQAPLLTALGKTSVDVDVESCIRDFM